FLCGIPGIQRTGTSLWWVPVAGYHSVAPSDPCVLLEALLLHPPSSSSSSFYSSLTSTLSSLRFPL
ncbi:unnamed protein product, partial [Staurois parvus]